MRVSYALSALSAFARIALSQDVPSPMAEQADAATITGGYAAYATEVVDDYATAAGCSHMCTVRVTEIISVITYSTVTETQPGTTISYPVTVTVTETATATPTGSPATVTVTQTATATASPATVTVTKTATATASVCTPQSVQWTTVSVVETATQTYTVSYPIVTSTYVECVEPGPGYPTEGYPVPDPAPTYGGDAAEGLDERHCGDCEPPPPTCGYITVTDWQTTVLTTVETVISGSATTVTVPTTIATTIPTTIIGTEFITRTSPTTIWEEITTTTTSTVTTEIPVTVIEDNTVIITTATTEYETVISTVLSSYPVTSWVTNVITDVVTETRPGETITGPGATVTQPGPTVTVPPETMTLPGEVITLPASTVTVTVTKDGETITTTVVKLPETITQPGQVITVTPIFEVTLCPTPTGAMAPLDTNSDDTFGCAPGYVCNPAKPAGCNFWPGLPSPEYLCKPEECILAPPFPNVTWPEGETSYYPPTYGYFDLNPEAFGLSFDIFEYEVYEEVRESTTVTIATGNWESQASLSEWPRPTTTTTTSAALGPYRTIRRALSKRDTDSPAVCFAVCNNAMKIALSLGKSASLCEDNSSFMDAYATCQTCVLEFGDETEDPLRNYIDPEFKQFLDYCAGDDAEPTATSATAPESAVTSPPLVTTTAQEEVSSGTFTPIEPSTTASDSTTSTASTTTSIQPTSTSTTEVVSEEPSSTTTIVESTTDQVPTTVPVDSTTTIQSVTESVSTSTVEEPATVSPERPGTTETTSTSSDGFVTMTTKETDSIIATEEPSSTETSVVVVPSVLPEDVTTIEDGTPISVTTVDGTPLSTPIVVSTQDGTPVAVPVSMTTIDGTVMPVPLPTGGVDGGDAPENDNDGQDGGQVPTPSFTMSGTSSIPVIPEPTNGDAPTPTPIPGAAGAAGRGVPPWTLGAIVLTFFFFA